MMNKVLCNESNVTMGSYRQEFASEVIRKEGSLP